MAAARQRTIWWMHGMLATLLVEGAGDTACRNCQMRRACAAQCSDSEPCLGGKNACGGRVLTIPVMVQMRCTNLKDDEGRQSIARTFGEEERQGAGDSIFESFSTEMTSSN